MFFNVVFSMFVCYSAAFCQLCFYNKDWIGKIGSRTGNGAVSGRHKNHPLRSAYIPRARNTVTELLTYFVVYKSRLIISN